MAWFSFAFGFGFALAKHYSRAKRRDADVILFPLAVIPDTGLYAFRKASLKWRVYVVRNGKQIVFNAEQAVLVSMCRVEK